MSVAYLATPMSQEEQISTLARELGNVAVRVRKHASVHPGVVRRCIQCLCAPIAVIQAQDPEYVYVFFHEQEEAQRFEKLTGKHIKIGQCPMDTKVLTDVSQMPTSGPFGVMIRGLHCTKYNMEIVRDAVDERFQVEPLEALDNFCVKCPTLEDVKQLMEELNGYEIDLEDGDRVLLECDFDYYLMEVRPSFEKIRVFPVRKTQQMLLRDCASKHLPITALTFSDQDETATIYLDYPENYSAFRDDATSVGLNEQLTVHQE